MNAPDARRFDALERRVSALEKAGHMLPERLTIKAVEKATGRNRMTIWRWCRAGKFPKPMFIGHRRVWRAEEVAQWLQEQIKTEPPPSNLTPGNNPAAVKARADRPEVDHVKVLRELRREQAEFLGMVGERIGAGDDGLPDYEQRIKTLDHVITLVKAAES